MGSHDKESQPVREHYTPVGKVQTLATWRMRMPVPTLEGLIVDLIIVSIYETTSVNGQPLDLLIEAQKTANDPIKRFGVIFSENPPEWSQYEIPILWRQDGHTGVGRWK